MRALETRDITVLLRGGTELKKLWLQRKCFDYLYKVSFMLKLELFNQEMNCLKSSSFKSRARKSIWSGNYEGASSIKVNKKIFSSLGGGMRERGGLCWGGQRGDEGHHCSWVRDYWDPGGESSNPSPPSSLDLFSFFHFMRRFWNQILIWRSVRHSAWAISIRLLRVR